MTWLKVSDKAASHPLVLGIAATNPEEPSIVNELFGYIIRCATESSSHLLDYHVPFGTALHFAGARGARFIDYAIHAGLWKKVTWTPDPEEQDPRPHLKLVEEEDLFHMPTRAQVLFERARRRDRDGLINAKIRLRDGDACRYCGHWVNPKDHTGARGWVLMTLDHLDPGKKLTSPDDGVVACITCNSSWGNKPKAERLAALREAPTKPPYTPQTKKILARHGLLDTGTYVDAGQQATAPGDWTEQGLPAHQPAKTPAIATAGTVNTSESVAASHAPAPGDGTEQGLTAPQPEKTPAIATAGTTNTTEDTTDSTAVTPPALAGDGSEGPASADDPAIPAALAGPSGEPMPPEQTVSGTSAERRAARERNPGRDGTGRVESGLSGSGRKARPPGPPVNPGRRKRRR